MKLKESFTSKVIKKVKEADQESKRDNIVLDATTFANIVETEADKYFYVSHSIHGGEHSVSFIIFSADGISLLCKFWIVDKGIYENDQKEFFTISPILYKDNHYLKTFDSENFYIKDAKLIPCQKYILRNQLSQDYQGFPYDVCSSNVPLVKDYIKKLRQWKDYIMLHYTSAFYDKSKTPDDRQDIILMEMAKFGHENLFFDYNKQDWYEYMSYDLKESVSKRQNIILEKWEEFKNLPKYEDTTIYHVLDEFLQSITEGKLSLELNHFYLGENSIIYNITQDSSKKCRKSHNLELYEGWITCKDYNDLDYSPHKEIFEEVVLNDVKDILTEYKLMK